MSFCAGLKTRAVGFVVDHQVSISIHETINARTGILAGEISASLPDGVVVEVLWPLGVQQDRRDIPGYLRVVNLIKHEISVALHGEPESTQWRIKAVTGIESPARFQVLRQLRRYSVLHVYGRAGPQIL